MEPFVLNKQLFERTEDQAVNGSPDPLLLYVEPWREQFSRMTAGFTTRQGGVGSKPYGTLNCAYHVGDDPSDVLENRRLVAEKLGFSVSAWTCGEQVHGKHVAVIQAEDRGRGLMDRQSALQDTDGLVTNVPGVLLTSFMRIVFHCISTTRCNKPSGLLMRGGKGLLQALPSQWLKRWNGIWKPGTGYPDSYRPFHWGLLL